MKDMLSGILSIGILLLQVISLMAIIIGIFKADLVLKFVSEEKRNKGKVLQVYELAIIEVFILVPITNVIYRGLGVRKKRRKNILLFRVLQSQEVDWKK